MCESTVLVIIGDKLYHGMDLYVGLSMDILRGRNLSYFLDGTVEPRFPIRLNQGKFEGTSRPSPPIHVRIDFSVLL